MKLCQDCKEVEVGEKALYCTSCRKKRKHAYATMRNKKFQVDLPRRRVGEATKKLLASEQAAEDQRAIEEMRELREWEKRRGYAGDPGRSLSPAEIERIKDTLTHPRDMADDYMPLYRYV